MNRHFYAKLHKIADPVDVLTALQTVSRHPKRHEAGFEPQELDSIVKCWAAASLACMGNADVVKEKERWAHFAKQLKDAIVENPLNAGICTLEERDWAPPQVFERAIKALEFAEVRSLA